VKERVDRGGKAFEQRDVVMIVEVTLQMVELLGLIEEDGDRPPQNVILILEVTHFIAKRVNRG
jgi:hypothetical protein